MAILKNYNDKTSQWEPLGINGKVQIEVDTNFLLEKIYPVGSIYMSVNSTSPASFLGGTWEPLRDRFLIGAGNLYPNGKQDGETTHILTESEMPAHEGHLDSNIGNWGGNARAYLSADSVTSYGDVGRGWNTQAGNEYMVCGHTKGTSSAHNNMPPYLAVNMWKRTA